AEPIVQRVAIGRVGQRGHRSALPKQAATHAALRTGANHSTTEIIGVTLSRSERTFGAKLCTGSRDTHHYPRRAATNRVLPTPEGGVIRFRLWCRARVRATPMLRPAT